MRPWAVGSLPFVGDNGAWAMAGALDEDGCNGDRQSVGNRLILNGRLLWVPDGTV